MPSNLDSISATSVTTDVLVVGGGIVGLTSALLLARAGVRVHLVERRATTSVHPRAWGWYPRSLEIFRQAGIEAQILAAAMPYRQHRLNARVESLIGKQLEGHLLPDAADLDDLTPCPQISLGQDELEPIVLDALTQLGVVTQFGYQAEVPFQQGEDVATLVSCVASGEQYTVSSKWVIAADGSRSGIRAAEGITQSGEHGLRRQVSILFRADLRAYLGDRRFSICQIHNDEVRGVLGHNADLTRGTLILTCDERHGPHLADYTPQRCAALIRAALGDPSAVVELIDVLPWTMSALVADRFVHGRVALVGDACHMVPPIGGYGANCGLQDAHNLAWRLATVIRGHADASILTDYARERHAIAEGVVDQARRRLAVRAGFASQEDHNQLLDPLWVMLGQSYDATVEMFADPRTRHAEVGTRFPHAWIRNGVSTLDIVDGWVLFCRPALATHLQDVVIDPLVAIALVPDEIAAWWLSQCAASDVEAILVRPDGIVAARGSLEAGTAEQQLQTWLRSSGMLVPPPDLPTTKLSRWTTFGAVLTSIVLEWGGNVAKGEGYWFDTDE